MKSILLLLFVSFLSIHVFSQTNGCGSPTVLPVNTSCSTTTFSVNQDNSNQEIDASCATGTAYSDAWYIVTGNGNLMTITISGANRDLCLAAFSSCASGQLACTMITSGSTGSISFPTSNLTNYYIQIQRRSGNTTNNLGGNICATSPASAGPVNDECTGAIALTVNPTTTCTTQTAGTIAGATASAQSNGCFGTADDDVWYSFVATSTVHTINLNNVAGSTTDLYHSVYGGSCGTPGTALVCSDPNNSTVSGLTIGNTYFVRVYSWTSTTGQTSTFDICIGTPVVPVNDECTGAIALTVNPTTTCTTQTAGTIAGATASAQSNGCFGTADDDVWYSFVATSTVHTINLNNVAGSTTDLYHSVYGGSCGTPGTALVCSDPNNSIVSGLTIGNTYFVRVYSYTSTTGQTSTFDICIGTPVVPANDECTGAIALTVNPNMLCGTQTAGTINNATPSVQTNGCGGTANDDVWYSFVATATTHSISLNNVAGSTTDLYHSVYGGSCGTPGTALVCSDPNSSSVSGLTIGNTYFVRVFSWTSSTGQTSTFNICIGTPVVPTNDECTGAISVTVNPDLLCGAQTAGTIAGATASAQSNGCGGTANDDVWYSFVATATTHIISLNNVNGSTTDLYHSVYGGSCGTPGAALVCSDPNSSTVTGLTIGNTYFIRIFSWSSTSGQTTTFNVCVGTLPPPPSNDECTGAISVPVTSTTGSCTYTTGSVASATASSQTNGCSGTADDDVWYSFVATATDVQIDLANVSGSTTDLYHNVYSGSCGSLGTALVCSDPNTSTVNGLTIGNTYFIRIFSYTSTAGQTSVFDLCVSEIGACGVTSATEDFCSHPATLTQGAGSWSSSTYPYYTADTPGNVGSLFCGSVENNSWYQFTAMNTTETFTFSTVANCVWGDGIQAEVFDITTDVNGCCTGFTAKSNCFNPGVMSTGTVTATGLTIGQTYFLMVDGYAGDNCDFTVTNWTAMGILLPVELYQFKGAALPRKNVLSWRTASEKDNDHFNIYRSEDGINFEKIGQLKGAGNSTSDLSYQFDDEMIRTGILYYQIGQVDIDGSEHFTQIISLNRNSYNEGVLAVYPNPTETNLYVELNASKADVGEKVFLTDLKGNILEQQLLTSDNFNKVVFNLSNLSGGMYILQYTNSRGESFIEKIIKK